GAAFRNRTVRRTFLGIAIDPRLHAAPLSRLAAAVCYNTTVVAPKTAVARPRRNVRRGPEGMVEFRAAPAETIAGLSAVIAGTEFAACLPDLSQFVPSRGFQSVRTDSGGRGPVLRQPGNRVSLC